MGSRLLFDYYNSLTSGACHFETGYTRWLNIDYGMSSYTYIEHAIWNRTLGNYLCIIRMRFWRFLAEIVVYYFDGEVEFFVNKYAARNWFSSFGLAFHIYRGTLLHYYNRKALSQILHLNITHSTRIRAISCSIPLLLHLCESQPQSRFVDKVVYMWINVGVCVCGEWVC